MDLRSLFSRSKHTSTSVKSGRTDNITSAGAHELLLEHEGFLGPTKQRPRRPTTADTAFATPRDSKSSHERSQKSSSDFRYAIPDHHSDPKRVPSQQKNGVFSRNRSTRNAREGHAHCFSQSSPGYAPEGGGVGRRPARGWLRRCISTNSRGHPSSSSSCAATLPYYVTPITEDDDDYTALPKLPGYEEEEQQLPDKPTSGAAARAAAAAAAQNEVMDSMRYLRLEPRVTRDSESGVGIEVRDEGDLVADFNFDIPVVRKGEWSTHSVHTQYILNI